MIHHIIAHDWRALRSDATLWIVVATLGASLAIGLATGQQSKRFLERSIDSARQDEVTRFQNLDKQLVRFIAEPPGPGDRRSDPRTASGLAGRSGSRFAILPQRQVAALSVGQSDLLPSAMRVSAEAREQVLSTTEIENPHRLLAGRFDPTFVVLYLYPLLIMALSYNVLAGEREEGTLALLLSQPVSLARVAGSKMLLRLALVVGIAVVVGAGGVIASGAAISDADTIGALSLWVGAVTLYGAFWLSVAWAIGSRGWGSATTALAVAGVWVALVIVVPSAVNLAVTTLYPIPSRVQNVQAVRAASDAAASRGSVLLAKYLEDHPELVPAESGVPGTSADAERTMAELAVTRVAVADEVQRLARPVVEQYERQVAGQRALAHRLRVASPALFVRDMLDDVAGTSAARHESFLAQVDAFHSEWRRYFTPLILQRAKLERFDQVPRFVFVEEPPSVMVRRWAPGLLVLSVATIALGVVGLRGLRRYPVAA